MLEHPICPQSCNSLGFLSAFYFPFSIFPKSEASSTSNRMQLCHSNMRSKPEIGRGSSLILALLHSQSFLYPSHSPLHSSFSRAVSGGMHQFSINVDCKKIATDITLKPSDNLYRKNYLPCRQNVVSASNGACIAMCKVSLCGRLGIRPRETWRWQGPKLSCCIKI